jgi:serine/threonine protein kinase
MIRERRMLEHLNHPFLCNLRYSFQDVEYLYIVVDLMTGGDLRFHISRKSFTEEAIRFWISQLGCALRYIHQQNIVHRDVKPDNVLLDSDGHVHLADFVRSLLDHCRAGLADRLAERCDRSHTWQAPYQSIGHISLPCARGIPWQGLWSRVRLVVVGCAFL